MDDALECVNFLLKKDTYVLQSWVSFLNPKCLWMLQPVYVLTQIVILLGGFVTLIHAYRNGIKWMYRWLSIAISGFVMELMSYLIPSIDSFWHSQSAVMFLHGRLPLHILYVYPVFYYTAMVRVSFMHLNKWAKPFAVAIVAVLVDMPYDIVGVKFLQWSWHDTDPNIYDRHYWVPWTSYYFHGVLSAVIFLITTGRWTDLFSSSVIAIPISLVAFAVFYHPLHDYAEVHTQLIVVALFSISVAAVWIDLTKDNVTKSSADANPINSNGILGVFIMLYYTFFLIIVLTVNPENQISVGLHQPIGSCNISEPVYTMSGKVLYRNVYLCIDKYDEGYFDFHCWSRQQFKTYEGPPVSWYVQCGTPFLSTIEYVVIISAICVLAFAVFYDIIKIPFSTATKYKIA